MGTKPDVTGGRGVSEKNISVGCLESNVIRILYTYDSLSAQECYCSKTQSWRGGSWWRVTCKKLGTIDVSVTSIIIENFIHI